MLKQITIGFCILSFVSCLTTTDDEWKNFVKVYGKRYSNVREEQYRMSIFKKSVDFIEKHNAEAAMGKHTYTVAINKYADMTNSEFVAAMNGFKPENQPKTTNVTIFRTANMKVPSSIDWRDEGIVTPIKDQGTCGSCWAFSAVGGLEGQHAKKTGTLVSLSEQQLVDCSELNNACDGGWTYKAFNYVKNNGGIDTEGSYPYDGRDENCRFKPDSVGATCTGYIQTLSGDEFSLQQAVASIGPVSICIDASHLSFQYYKQGVYHEPNCRPFQSDHCVLVVGYDTTSDEVDYWIVKNSWGTDWGQNGYIWMSRNNGNNCGVSSYAYYPTM